MVGRPCHGRRSSRVIFFEITQKDVVVCQQSVAIPETNRRNFPGGGSAFRSSIAIAFSPSQMVDHRTRTDCRTRARQSSRARRSQVKFAPVENYRSGED